MKIMAKDLVRTRRYVKKFMLMKANIQAVSLKIQTLRSQNTMAQAMKGVTKAMQSMNKYVILRLFIVLELQLFYYFLINTFCSFHKLFSIIHLFIFLRC